MPPETDLFSDFTPSVFISHNGDYGVVFRLWCLGLRSPKESELVEKPLLGTLACVYRSVCLTTDFVSMMAPCTGG